MDLKNIRENIDRIDKEMAKLFEERMRCVEDVINYKIENDVEIFDEKREKIVIDKNKNLIGNKKYEKYYIKFIKDVMNISKDYQRDILKNKDKNKRG